MKRAKMMVLNDGATFTNLKGCCIVSVPADWDTTQIEDALRDRADDPMDLKPWRLVTLYAFTAEDEQHALTDAEEADLDRPFMEGGEQ